MGNGVSDYLKKQKSPQKEICTKLRKIILKAFPKIGEKMYVGVPWYEGRYYIVALKDHVNLGFSVKGLKKSEMGLFEGRGKMMRHKKFFTLNDSYEKDEVKLLIMIKPQKKCH